jgi:hypothetical protein
MRTLLAIALVAAFAGSARAEKFDMKGWKLLGKGTVSKQGETTVTLRNYDGNIDELTIQAGAMRVTGFHIDHTNLEDLDRELDFVFDRYTPTVAIDLAGNQDTLEAVTLRVAAVEKDVDVYIFGRDRTRPEVATTDADKVDLAGFTELGTMLLDATAPGALSFSTKDRVSKLVFASSANLDVLALTFHTTEGDWRPYLTLKFRDHSRVLAVELPSPLQITSVDFEYTHIGKTAGHLTMYGLEPYASARVTVARAASAEPSEPGSWTLLAEDEVDLIDEELDIARSKSTWSEVKLVVSGDAVTLKTVELQLAGKAKQRQREELEESYGEGDSQVIEISGRRRAIKKIRLTYEKHRLDADTRVQVYAR